jgi:GNAT superfamily N-acetyltransferase
MAAPISGDEPVVLAESGHDALLADFNRQVWDPGATPQSVGAARSETARSNLVAPGTPFPTYLFLHEGRVIGHLSSRPTRIWAGGAETPGYWLKGLHVLPAYRNGPVGLRLVQTAARELQPAMALVVMPAARRLFTALGFRDYGVMPNFVRVLRGSRVVRAADPVRLGFSLGRLPHAVLRTARIPGVDRVAGGLLDAALALWTRFWRLRPGRAPLINQPVARDLDALWESARQDLVFAPARSADYLIPRYCATPEMPYEVIGASRNGTLEAMAVLRRPRDQGDPRLAGLRVATVAEVLHRPAAFDGGSAVLNECCRRGRQLGADALLCTTAHRSTIRLLLRSGFVRLSGNVHFLARGLPDPDLTLENALLTRGDSDADEVF